MTRLPLIVRTVAVGQYVTKVETTLVTVVVPKRPLETVPVVTLEAEEIVVTAVPELALEVEDAAVLEATVLFDRVVTAVWAETQAARTAGMAKIEKRIVDG